MSVPDVLVSGHHKEIEDWRQSKRKHITQEKRPDLWRQYLKNSEIVE
jgi:tRNA (guanine37-N1)-methyltransferase